MIGLLCLGKPDFDAIKPFRADPFFRHALNMNKVPSEVTLRQRLDAGGRFVRSDFKRGIRADDQATCAPADSLPSKLYSSRRRCIAL